MAYDSKPDTLVHIARVQRHLESFCDALEMRGKAHDYSKLSAEEKPYYDEAIPRIKDTLFGTPEYTEAAKLLGPGLEHHKAVNSHHPEFYDREISGMDLLDLVEMFCDWRAANERDGGKLTFSDSTRAAMERYGIGGQLAEILVNTVERHKFYA